MFHAVIEMLGRPVPHLGSGKPVEVLVPLVDCAPRPLPESLESKCRLVLEKTPSGESPVVYSKPESPLRLTVRVAFACKVASAVIIVN